MELNEALEYLEKDSIFMKWRKTNKKDYFSSAFKILMDGRDNDWQFGFYNQKKDTITTFSVEDGKTSIREDEKIFKKDGKREIKEVKLESATLSLNSIIQKAEDYKNEKYPKEICIKIIAILQSLKGFGVAWNITFITAAFNTLNMKISASDGRVLYEKLESILAFRKEA